jgi:hypothetical protein
MLKQRPAFNRLALAAALLFAVWQGLSAQHLHAGEPLQTECAVCATAQLDDAALDVAASSELPALGHSGNCVSLTPRHYATALPAYGARAPPTS